MHGKKPVTKASIIMVFLVAIFIFVVSLYIGVTTLSNIERLRTSGERSTGIVSNIVRHRSGRSVSYRVYITHVYKGEPYQKMFDSSFKTMRVGQEYEIYFDPLNPNDFELTDADWHTYAWVLYLSVSILLFIVSAYLLNKKRKETKS